MPSGQAMVDAVARSIAFNDSTGRPYVAFIRDIRRLLRAEQAAMALAGQSTRTDTGVMTLMPASGGPPQRIPTIIAIGADGAAAGEDGHDATINDPSLNGHILIAAGGSASRGVSITTNGGSGQCIGGGENLLIALGGDGAIPLNPRTMPYGANGIDGGDGGSALAVSVGNGCVIYAEGGDGAQGSPGQIGGRVRLSWFSPSSLVAPGTDGNDGDGGDAIIVAGNHATLTAIGGSGAAPRPASALVLGPTTRPGRMGKAGKATIHHGPIDVQAFAQNGNGATGTIIVH